MNPALRDRLRSLYPFTFNGIDAAPALAALAEIESNLDPSAIGGAGETSAWQVLPETARKLSMGPTPKDLLAQAEWIAPLVREAVRSGAFENLPRWWRHGHLPATPTPLDWTREARFKALYSTYAAGGGAAAGGGFPVAVAPAPTLGGVMDPKKIREALDKVRAQADRVRKTVDTVATVVSSIPFLGGVVGGYVRTAMLVVDGLDNAIDDLDDSVDATP